MMKINITKNLKTVLWKDERVMQIAVRDRTKKDETLILDTLNKTEMQLLRDVLDDYLEELEES